MRISEVVEELREAITSKLVASLAGVKEPGKVDMWAQGELEPSQREEQRLLFASEVIREIAAARGLRVAQAWAASANPRLGGESPLMAIRNDRFQDTAAAANALMEDGYDG